jgi:NADH:ubiquinone oxidoreductase subunit E
MAINRIGSERMEGKTVAATKACCPDCSTEQFSEIANIIDLYKDKEGSLIQVLHRAQEIYGYLPLELQSFIADGMGLPLSEVSGVVTFYSFFSTKPRGKHTLRICMGTACYVRGGKKLVDTIQDTLNLKIGDTTADGLFTFEVARCIGACGLAPAIMVDDTVYKQVTPSKLKAILAEYRKKEVSV